MRFVARVVACAGVLLAAAGCNPVTDRQYMNEGAGVQLGYDGLPAATERQQTYVDEICEQAGYPEPKSADATSSCMDGKGWDAFVLAGINDINERCDGYLTWLDARRRDRAPVLKELLAVTGATNAILNANGAAASTLSIVSAAMALAGASYENWNSRLLLAINQSTVQEMVYSRQAQFIEQNGGKHVASRPAAIYLLRNYLRLCMPTTIEADINTSMTLIQRGNPMDAKNNPLVKVAGSVAIIPDPTKQLPPPAPQPPPKENRFTVTELYMDSAAGEINRIQKALCVAENGDLGPLDSSTRAAIRDYLMGRQYRNIKADTVIKIDNRMRIWLGEAVTHVGNCANPAFGFANAYEVGRLGYPAEKRIQRIKAIQGKLQRFFTNSSPSFPPPDVTGILDFKTRLAIAELRKRTVPPQPRPVPHDTELDPAIYRSIINLK
jgi:hypothetical protein